jgi:hypothetical protein
LLGGHSGDLLRSIESDDSRLECPTHHGQGAEPTPALAWLAAKRRSARAAPAHTETPKQTPVGASLALRAS